MQIEQPAPEIKSSDGPMGATTPQPRRGRAKWASLHEALSQLKQARALATENAGSAEVTGAIDEAGTR
jgi:hypothetical protein